MGKLLGTMWSVFFLAQNYSKCKSGSNKEVFLGLSFLIFQDLELIHWYRGIGSFLLPLKTPEKQTFSDVFGGKKGNDALYLCIHLQSGKIRNWYSDELKSLFKSVLCSDEELNRQFFLVILQCLKVLWRPLTHFTPKHHFYPPWKCQ